MRRTTGIIEKCRRLIRSEFEACASLGPASLTMTAVEKSSQC
jgi:hypothetical protein